jgi:hypothetical protein
MKKPTSKNTKKTPLSKLATKIKAIFKKGPELPPKLRRRNPALKLNSLVSSNTGENPVYGNTNEMLKIVKEQHKEKLLNHKLPETDV